MRDIFPPHENLSITSSSNLPRGAIADKANAGAWPLGAALVLAPPPPVISLLRANYLPVPPYGLFSYKLLES